MLYSGIEQAMKCLLKMSGLYRAKLHRNHDIGKLFRDLVPEEQQVVDVAYSAYRSLHNYIPLKTSNCFLDYIDEGYQQWRYLLLEGPEKENRPPKTHVGAMLEIWSALAIILQARVTTKHELYTVDRRIVHYLDETTRHVWVIPYWGNIRPEETADMNCWRQAYDDPINAYADLFSRFKENELHLLKVPSHTLEVLNRLVRTVNDEVKKENVDYDIWQFVWRAESGTIKWNTQLGLFENPSD